MTDQVATLAETRLLDLTGRTYVGPLCLAPCGTLTPEHAPHVHTLVSGDVACAGTPTAVDLVQRVAGGDHHSSWWV